MANTWLINSPKLTLYSRHTSPIIWDIATDKLQRKLPIALSLSNPSTVMPLSLSFYNCQTGCLRYLTFICQPISSASSHNDVLSIKKNTHTSSHLLFHDFVYVVSFFSNPLIFLPNGKLLPILQNMSSLIYSTFLNSTKLSYLFLPFVLLLTLCISLSLCLFLNFHWISV